VPDAADDASVRSAWALAAILWAIARPLPPEALGPCPRAAEAAARDGHTVAFRCASCTSHATEGHCETPFEALRPVRGPARLLFGCRVDVNRADPRTLEALPRIGPVRARAIVAERTRHPFRSLDDLERVHGIGPATVAGLRGRARALAEGPDRSQICSPSLPNSCENSYTNRAGTAGPDRGLPGGFPSCD
jgi:hypothetical protein